MRSGCSRVRSAHRYLDTRTMWRQDVSNGGHLLTQLNRSMQTYNADTSAMILSISSRMQLLLLGFLFSASFTSGRESYELSHLRRQERDAVHSPSTRAGRTRSLSPINCTSTDTPVPITQENIHNAVREWLDDRDVACSIYGPIDAWNTTSVTNMTKLFVGSGDFQGNIANWDVSNVVTMERMFRYWNLFDMDLSAWNVSHVESFYEMFRGSSFANALQCWCWEISPTANQE